MASTLGFFQSGETNYGKPIIDRVITSSTPVADATKCVLLSFDLTMHSNLSAGMPIELICYKLTVSTCIEGAGLTSGMLVSPRSTAIGATG